MDTPFGFGAHKSPLDIRTFSYVPSPAPQTGGHKYAPEDIEHQHTVGICTAISLTQNARKALGRKFSAEFQYLLQKREYDGDWDEGSSISSALKVGKKFGFLPEEEWTYTTEADRKFPYDQYLAKLQAIPEAEITRLKALALPFALKGYAKVPVQKDYLENAINESSSGVLTRFDVGDEWYTPPIEPLRKPKSVISGHAITNSNFDGGSLRVANTWGNQWASEGTAYYFLNDYAPTEAWIPYYNQLPAPIQNQQDQLNTLYGKLLTLLQKLISMLRP